MQAVPMSRSNGGRTGHISPDLSLLSLSGQPFYVGAFLPKDFHKDRHTMSAAEKPQKSLWFRFPQCSHKVLNKCRIKVDVVCNDIPQVKAHLCQSIFHFSDPSKFKNGLMKVQLNVNSWCILQLTLYITCMFRSQINYTFECTNHKIQQDKLAKDVEAFVAKRLGPINSSPIHFTNKTFSTNTLSYNILQQGGWQVRWRFHWKFSPSYGVNFWVRCASGNVFIPLIL